MSMNRNATTLVMGALKELLNNRELAYVSTTNPKFSHLEDAGKEFVVEIVELVIPMLVAAQQKKSLEDAEELMLRKLS